MTTKWGKWPFSMTKLIQINSNNLSAQPTNCLSVFFHFVRLALKSLRISDFLESLGRVKAKIPISWLFIFQNYGTDYPLLWITLNFLIRFDQKLNPGAQKDKNYHKVTFMSISYSVCIFWILNFGKIWVLALSFRILPMFCF